MKALLCFPKELFLSPLHFSHRSPERGSGAVGKGRFLLASVEGSCEILIRKIKLGGGN